MSDYTTTPLENQFETQIVGEISSGSTVPFNITVKKAVSFTPASGGFYAVLEPGTSKEEGLKITSVSGTTWTVGTRGIPIAKGGTSTTTSHGGGAKIIISDNWSNFDDIATAINSKAGNAEDETITGDWTFSGDNVFSGSLKVPVYADATARDAAITSPANGMLAYLTDTGVMYQYIGGAWATFATGTTSNASTTVAGKGEEATQAEIAAATAAGGTGARLFTNPSTLLPELQKSAYSFAADAEASDTYVIALTPTLTAYTTGQRFNFTANTANTGAATLNVDALGAKPIIKGDATALVTGDILAGQVVEVVYDGTTMVMTSLPDALVSGADANAQHKHTQYVDLISITVAAADATANQDTTVTTTATPQTIDLQITAYDAGGGTQNLIARAVYLGSTIKWVWETDGPAATAITYNELAGSNGNISTNPASAVFGSGGNTQTVTITVDSVTSTSAVIRVANTKAGTGSGANVSVKIGYIIHC